MLNTRPDSGLDALSHNNDFLAQNYKSLQRDYGGKHIAVVSDTEEVISGDSVKEVIAKVKKKATDPEKVTIEYIPEEGEVVLF